MFENWTVGMWLGLIVGILAFIFWIVEFIDMIKSKKLKKETKLILAILFIVASILTAIIYWVWKNI
jgi:H+/Cl- antiporter ClcA